jgi:TetR/AcrR family transcriptional regulator, mexJK operon transcriptional repressor
MAKGRIAGARSEPRRARGRPKAEDVAQLEATLLRVAHARFVANGYGATSMNEIAKTARVSKTTLYSRFTSKGELFRGIIDQQIQHTGDVVRHVGPKPRTLDAMLRVFTERALQESLRRRTVQINRLIYGEAERFPELGAAAWARTQIGVRHVSELIQEYAAKERIPCRRPSAVADVFTTLLRGVYSDVMLRDRTMTKAEISSWTRKTLKVFLAGRRHW